MADVDGPSRVLISPLGRPSRRLQRCGFGRTLFEGMRTSTPSDKVLIDIDTKKSITFAEFLIESELISKHLLMIGCRGGDVIAIFAPNSIRWLLIMAAAFRIGLIPAGINHLHKIDEVRHQLNLCRAKYLFSSHRNTSVAVESVASTTVERVLIIDGDHAECISMDTFFDSLELLPSLPDLGALDISPLDVALIMFSSGTTGRQKAVQLSHVNLQSQFIISTDEQVRKVANNQIVFAPFSHLAGSVMTLYAAAAGYTTYIMTEFRLEKYLDCLSQNQNESIAIVPSVAVSLAKEPDVDKYDLRFLKEIICGTAPLSKQIEDLILTRFPWIHVRQGYGLTETTALCCIVPRRQQQQQQQLISITRPKSGSVGVPLFDVEMKIVQPDSGAISGPNENGELLIRSPLVTTNGYIDVDGDGFSFLEVVDEDGWLHSGDQANYDEDGYIWIVDRIKDIIKYNSFQVSPTELESVLLSHPDVVDAAVFALRDQASCNELPAAWVVVRSGSNPSGQELDSYVSGLVASYKKLRGGISFVPSIPKSATGKILRRQIQLESNGNARIQQQKTHEFRNHLV